MSTADGGVLVGVAQRQRTILELGSPGFDPRSSLSFLVLQFYLPSPFLPSNRTNHAFVEEMIR
jgi:hypothetical protein